MLRRLFLTFLALLTGFYAQVGPTNARALASRCAEASAIQAQVGANTVNVPARLTPQSTGMGKRIDTGLYGAPPQALAIPAPRVELRIDRARE